MLHVRTIFTGVAGLPGYSNLYFQGDTLSEATGAANAVQAFYLAIRGFQSNLFRAQVQSEVAVVDPTTGNTTDVLSVPAQPLISGAANAALLPPGAQAVVRFSTPLFRAGRRVQGRTNVPGWTTSANDPAGAPSAQLLGDLRTAAAALIADTNSVLVVYSPTGGVFGAVSGSSVLSRWGTLRSRAS